VVADRTEKVFVGDIAYLESDKGVHYLSWVADACIRKIMGCEVGWETKVDDVAKVLKRMIGANPTLQSSIHHSYRGLQIVLRNINRY
jgi:putative transposase